VMPQADLVLVCYQPDAEAQLKILGLNREKVVVNSSPIPQELIADALRDKRTVYQPNWSSNISDPSGLNWANSSLIIEPLVLANVSLGAIAIISNRAAAFSQDYHQVLAMLANQAAIALQNARLYREARRADELEALYETGKAITRTLNLQDTLISIMGITRSLTGASTSNIYLYTPEHHRIDSVISLEDNLSLSDADRRRSAELASQVMENHQSGPVLDKDRVSGATEEDHSIRSRLVVPLATSDTPVGVLELGSEYPDTFTANDVRLVQVIASQAAVAIENARLYEEVQQRLQQTEALGVISRSISNTLDLSRVLNLVVQSAAKTIPVATHSTLYLLDPNNQTFVPEARFSRQSKSVPPDLAKVIDQTIQQFLVNDVTTRTSWQSEEYGDWSLLIAPLKVNEIVIGAISIESPRPDAFHTGDEILLNTFASHASVAIQNANLFRDLSSAYLDLASKQEEILRNNRTLQALFDSITDGLYIVDQNLHIIAINQAEAKRLGKTTDLLIGQTCDATLWGETTEALSKIILHTFEAGEERNWESQIDAGKRGPFTDRDVRTYPIFDSSRKVSQVIIFAHDVSEQRRLQASLFRSANLAAVGQLASSIAHQINNPLTVIIANTQLMQMDADPASLDYPIITDVVEAGTQIRQIVQNLLDFSTQESYEWFETDVGETIDDALNLVAHSLRKSRIEVEKKIPDLPSIIASSSHLKLLWMNLLLNARDAISAAGEVEGKVEILANQIDADWIEVQIKDNGIGIPQEL
ncbi:MAG: GAF domain-containing protein, partial [Chloroflexota bacterium]